MASITSEDGVKIFYRMLNKRSEKPVLVFVHGWLANWTCFKREIRFFREKGFPVIYLDLRGHGRSGKPQSLEEYHLDIMVKDLLSILDKEHVKRCVLVGHSMGGMVSSIFSLYHKDRTEGLVLIDSSYENPLFSSKIIFFHRHRRFAKLICNFIVNHTLAKTHFGHIKELDISKIWKFSDIRMFLDLMIHTPLHSAFAALEAMFRYDLKGKLSKISAPTLIIGSSKDEIFSKKLEYYFSKNIPHSSYVLDKGTHSLIIKEPHEVALQIEQFLEKRVTRTHNKF